ncbi:MAG: hypothetical protein ABI554_12985 [Flavobacterium sp.]
MSKNTEILAEIITEQLSKLEKSASDLKGLNEELLISVKMASNIEINTKRLEEVIEHWNGLFIRQKSQIVELQKGKSKSDIIYKLIILGLTTIIILLIFKTL